MSTLVKKQLLMYINYHYKMGNYRPVFFSKYDLSDNSISDLMTKCMELYKIKRCHCCYDRYFVADKKKICKMCISKGPIFCEGCSRFRLYDDFHSFPEFPETTEYDRCTYCAHEKSVPEEHIDEYAILSPLIETSGYILQECAECSQDFCLKTDQLMSLNCGKCKPKDVVRTIIDLTIDTTPLSNQKK